MIENSSDAARMRPKKSRRRLLAVAVGIALAVQFGIASGAEGATPSVRPPDLYAAPAAVGAGDCSSSADACSLADALTAAVPRSVIRLTTAGVAGDSSSYYVGNWTATTAGTSAAKPVTITAARGIGTPVLDGNRTLGATCSTTNCDAAMLIVYPGVHLNIAGITIQDAGSSSAHGGGIGVYGGNVTVTRTTFADNVSDGYASEGGAISVLGGGTLAVSASTFVNNAAGYFAGAIGVGASPSDSGTATITTSTFTGNHAALGYTIGVGDFYGYGDLTVTNSTFSANAGAIDLAVNYGGGSIHVAGNVFDDTCSIDPTYLEDGGYNVGVDGSCQNGGPGGAVTLPPGSPHSPALGKLTDNGGPTRTIILRPAFPTNPAIEAIPDATSVTLDGSSVALCPVADQRGLVGPIGACHAGALQRVRVASRPSITALTPDTGTVAGGTQIDITGTDFLTGATVAIGKGNGSAITLTDVTVVSGTEITATTPAGAKPGRYRVYVTTAGGTSRPGKLFTYTAGP